jgi:hypothetical protein
MPIKFMPLVRDVITSAPISDPTTLPTPPAADTPPTKAAAIASNSKSCVNMSAENCLRGYEIVYYNHNQDDHRSP